MRPDFGILLESGFLVSIDVDLKLCNRTKRSAKLDMRQFSSAKSELYYSCKEEKEVFINLQSAADKIKHIKEIGIMEKAILQLETLSCPSCMQKIEGALKSVNGIDKDSIKVLFNSSKVKINFDSAVTSIEEIQKAIENVGYSVLKAKVKAA